MSIEYLSLHPVPAITILDQENDILLLRKDPVKRKRGIKGYDDRGAKINGIAAEIIALLNGRNTRQDIIDYFLHKYGESVPEIERKIEATILSISEFGFEIVYTSVADVANPSIDIQNLLLPVCASIELTSNCNLKCKHCYGEYGPEENSAIPRPAINPLLKDLKDIGVSIIELTGGDPSVYPFLKEVLEEALTLGFSSIAILTNGLLLKEEVLNTIEKNNEKIFIQIDMHSLSDEYLHWFTGAAETVKRIHANITRLLDNGVEVVVASIITPGNVHEVKDIVQWAVSVGVRTVRFSPVIDLGRAASYRAGFLDYTNLVPDEEIFLTTDQFLEFEKQIMSANKEFPGIISFVELNKSRRNCGTLSTHVAICPSGDIKICTMDSDYFDIQMGNVLEKPIRQIYQERAELVKAIASLPDPSIDDEECAECKHKFFCSNCLVRSFLKAKEEGPKCRWYNEKVPEIIKKNISL